jgi:hypothetical protein
MDDCGKKGRRCCGERHPRLKLTAEQVIAIRDAQGLHREIGKQFGVSSVQVSRIKCGTRRGSVR